jgi:hypothetical protein
MNFRPVPVVDPVRVCRFCGCTPEASCRVPGGDECAFLTPKADRCNAPGCVAAFEREMRDGIERDRQYRRMVQVLRVKGKKKQRSKSRQRRAA